MLIVKDFDSHEVIHISYNESIPYLSDKLKEYYGFRGMVSVDFRGFHPEHNADLLTVYELRSGMLLSKNCLIETRKIER